MVVGNGLIARSFRAFQDNKDLLLFCSGVSNSRCTDPAEFNREQSLLADTIQRNGDKMLVYFSTCSIQDPSMINSMYVKHKLALEEYIRQACSSYHIFRLSNVVGNTSNRITVLNFLYDSIREGKHFDLWKDSNRNLIDAEHAVEIVKRVLLLDAFKNTTINIANKYSHDVVDIVECIEQFLGVTGNYTLLNKGSKFQISISDIERIVSETGIHFEGNYVQKLLEKYYRG